MNCLESGEHLVLGSHPVTVSNKVNYKQRKFLLVASLIAGEPHANQHTILYNSGKKPKFVVFPYLLDVRSEACAVD